MLLLFISLFGGRVSSVVDLSPRTVLAGLPTPNQQSWQDQNMKPRRTGNWREQYHIRPIPKKTGEPTWYKLIETAIQNIIHRLTETNVSVF
jgi:hypothetical protein